MIYYNKIFINGLQVQGDNCPYYASLYNFLLDSNNTNNDSDLYSNGSYSGSSKINSKTFTLQVATKDDDDIRSALQLTHVIRSGEISLIADVEGLGEVECLVKKESVTTDDFGIMNITFKLCDPNIYSKDYKELILERTIEGGFKVASSFTIPSSWSYTENVKGNIGEIINNGFATIYPIIEIEGEARDFKILNKATGEQLNLNYNLESGELLCIDCNPATRCVKVNNNSIISSKSGSYISLISGSNEIEIDYIGECVCKVRWREVWI